MNWLLMMVVFLVAGNMVWGFEKGIVRMLYSVVGWVAVLAMTVWLTTPLEKWLEKGGTVNGETSSTFAAFATALILSKLIFCLVVRVLDLFTKLPLIEEANRFAGVLAGMGKGVFVTEIMMILISLGRNTEFGECLVQQVYLSPLLTFFYENNVIQAAVMALL